MRDVRPAYLGQGNLMDLKDKAWAVASACLVAGALLLGAVLYYQGYHNGHAPKEVAYSEFLDDLTQDRVKAVELRDHEIRASLGGQAFIHTFAPDDPDLIKTLRAKQIKILVPERPVTHTGSWVTVLTTLLPTILLVGLALFFMNRGARGGAGLGRGKSKARLLSTTQGRITFADVAGVDEARDSLQEIVEFLRDPHKFERLGGRIPRGVLLVGPPGTGKTLLARAVAGEADVPFFTISGSDFVEMFVGVGASRVRDMFAEAKKNAPCIIFMDEIDAVGRKRGAGLGQGNDEREQTLNQLLVEMDGFEANEGVILIAATNRPDVLDPALLRPGRFDREVVVNNPDIVGREQILQVHVRRVPLASKVDLKSLARTTPGFSGADLMNLVNEAALLAVRRERETVGMAEFEEAKDTVTMGAERRTHVMSDEERLLTAYREGGKAIVALHVPAADPLHKATIVTRGRSMGQVKQLPEADQAAQSLKQMTSRLAITLAGRAAEELVFGRDNITSGTAADIETATKLARDMVTRFGLSEALGTVAYAENQDEVFLGNSVTRTQNVSEETAQLIQVEVRKLVDGGLADARTVLERHRAELDRLAQGLLTYETLSGAEIRGLLAGQPPVRDLGPGGPEA
jgi:cell division protease FtsH